MPHDLASSTYPMGLLHWRARLSLVGINSVPTDAPTVTPPQTKQSSVLNFIEWRVRLLGRRKEKKPHAQQMV
jgi:hypothetical protein